MDVVAVEAAARRAAARDPRGRRAAFLECRTYRFRAHSMFDAQLYRDKAEVEEWKDARPDRALRGWMTRGRHAASTTRPRGASRRGRRRDRRRRSPLPRPAPGSRSTTLTRLRHTAEVPQHEPRRTPSTDDHLSRGRARGDPRRDEARRARLPDGRGCRPLRRLLCRQQGPARRVRARAHPRHAAVRIRLRRRGHRRGAGRHAARSSRS